jgi:glutamyl-tRNA reductase
MRFSVFGMNHRNAPLEVREPYQLARSELEEACRLFKEVSGCKEVVVMATCHRIEFYRVREVKGNPRDEFAAFYRARGLADPEKTAEICYHLHETSAARHLFRVASGLDSVILGEDQVLHQLKDAYSAACAASTAGKILHRAFHLAFTVSKRVRSETSLGAGPRGVPGAALDLLKGHLKGQPPAQALICGVNDATEIILEGLSRWGVAAILANRTLKRAQKLAAEFGATAISLDEIPQVIGRVEAVFSATAAPGYMITRPHCALADRGDKPLVLMDLASPRDIDPALADLPGVTLFDLQDIQHAVERCQQNRAAEIPQAQDIVEEQVKVYSNWRKQERQQTKILDLHREMNRLRREELEKFKEAFRPSDYRALESFSHVLIRNCLKLAPKMLGEQEEDKKGE